jgi:hypothetical protein
MGAPKHPCRTCGHFRRIRTGGPALYGTCVEAGGSRSTHANTAGCAKHTALVALADEVTIGAYLRAERVPCDPHDTWLVRARDGSILALAEWYQPWRRYVLTHVEADAVFSADCCAALAAWLKGL